MKKALLVSFSILALVGSAQATTWTFDAGSDDLDDFSADRTEPTDVEITDYEGHSCLHLGVYGEDQSTVSAYYYTEGVKHALAEEITGTWVLSAELYLSEDWSTTPPEYRTDLWGYTYDETGSVASYPIIGFAQTIEGDEGEDDITVTGGFQIWDGTGWVQVADADGLYGTWVTLTIVGSATSFEYYINGELVYTDYDTEGTYSLAGLILQVKNYGGDYDYSTYYDNVSVSAVPEPMTMLAVGAALTGLGGYIRRRRRA